ncbi:MAG: DsbA family protein [Actinomycetota bacterium]|nr:DsbA family protein [Actinomycetota bacterium]
MAGSSTASGATEPAQPVFYFDLASPEAYLVAERVLHALPEAAEWQPVWLGGLRAGEVGAGWRCAQEAASHREDVERRAAAQGLQPVRWPEPFPASGTRFAMLVATYAKQIGRTVAFAQAAFRQAFAGGRDLSQRDWVLMAAAACEMHPAAVIKGAELGSTARRLDEATEAAAAAGVLDVPAIRVDDRVFHGDAEVDAAAATLTARAAQAAP